MKQITIIALAGFLITGVAFAQEADSLNKIKIEHYSKMLGVTEKKSKDIVLIMDQYKESAKQIINNAALSQDEKKIKFTLLIDDKNSKLKKILTASQLEKVIPPSEIK